jgi:hypothetical protein
MWDALGSLKASRKAKPIGNTRERPPCDRLLAEIEAHGYCWVGRKYGVSDNAVRKWVKFYERERERNGLEPSA